VALALSACGGGGGGNGGGTAPPAAPVVADARFTEDLVVGLGFSVADVTEGRTDAVGSFKVAQGKRVDFFVGDGSNRVVVGTANPNVQSADTLISFSLHDLNEARAENGEQHLGNVLRLFAALDANADFADGIQIDAAANAAIAQAVAGGKTLSFKQAEDAFAADPVVVAVLGTLDRELASTQAAFARFSLFFRQSRASSIALTSDDKRAVVVNRLKSSVSVIRVRNGDGTDSGELIGEVSVGQEPRFVALSLDDSRAFVTNGSDGTMSVIDLTTAQPKVLGQALNVGFEPRGIAVTPNGTFAFIANFSTGNVTVVRLATPEVVGTVQVGGNPYSVAITNDGDDDDNDERVFVTQFFSEQIDAARPVVFDDSKQGVVTAFNVGSAVQGTAQLDRLLLKPLASGFSGDRRPFCLQTRQAQQAAGTAVFFNSGADGTLDGASLLKNQTFCPDATSSDSSDNGPIGKNPQNVYPNQLYSLLIRGPLLYVPSIGAQPEPPVRFNLNVQGLVGVLDRVNDVEAALTVNLNQQVIRETAGTDSLDKLFLNDIVAVDADRGGRDFLIVSRGGNYVVRAKLAEDGKLTMLDANNKALRLQTGNLPSGVVMSRDGTRAYANNDINTSISALDLVQNTVLARDIEASAPPAPGTNAHRIALGELAFFTALGLPDTLDTNGDGTFDIPLRDVNPLQHKNKASNGAWSSCGSCHMEGHSDNVTWSFVTGPRQTIPLEGTFARNDLSDQRILNWSAVQGSVTDFNNNARNVQGGTGFASNVNGENRSTLAFNHGPTQGVSDSLDAMSEWVATVRAPNVPQAPQSSAATGRALFEANCASCHGGAKWTKSRTSPLYQNDPTFAVDPIGINFFAGVLPIDGAVKSKGPQILGVFVSDGELDVLLKLVDGVGTFDPTSPIEIRGAAAVAGQSTQGFASFGADGFNAPSLLGLSISAPYFHDGSAATLEDVVERHELDSGQTIAEQLSAEELQALLDFVRGIDDRTQVMDSIVDAFLKDGTIPASSKRASGPRL
jgi:DNA-binding beta-propeller fold protein YncE